MSVASKNDGGKKSILLRLNAELWNELAAMSDEEFRSINGQIEYLLNEAVKQRRKNSKNRRLKSEGES